MYVQKKWRNEFEEKEGEKKRGQTREGWAAKIVNCSESDILPRKETRPKIETYSRFPSPMMI